MNVEKGVGGGGGWGVAGGRKCDDGFDVHVYYSVLRRKLVYLTKKYFKQIISPPWRMFHVDDEDGDDSDDDDDLFLMIMMMKMMMVIGKSGHNMLRQHGDCHFVCANS